MAVTEQKATLNEVRLNEAFREAMRRFATTVSIISCSDEEGRLHGMSATAVASVCVEPPTLLICINNSTATHGALSRSGRFCVNILRSFHSELSQVFSGKMRGDDRFRLGIGIELLTVCRFSQMLKPTCSATSIAPWTMKHTPYSSDVSTRRERKSKLMRCFIRTESIQSPIPFLMAAITL
jgi:hypothetical protein